MDYKTFIKSYWNYYLDLEEQFLATKRYVEFDRVNGSAYSIEYLKLLQAVCSEIDVVAKKFAENLAPLPNGKKYKSIQSWGYCLQLFYPNIESMTVSFNYDSSICPWQNWKYIKYLDKSNNVRYRLADTTKLTPEWWTAYNKVKHQRTSPYETGTNYMRANQENLINAMAALFILENLYLDSVAKDEKVTYNKSKVFQMQTQNA